MYIFLEIFLDVKGALIRSECAFKGILKGAVKVEYLMCHSFLNRLQVLYSGCMSSIIFFLCKRYRHIAVE